MPDVSQDELPSKKFSKKGNLQFCYLILSKLYLDNPSKPLLNIKCGTKGFLNVDVFDSQLALLIVCCLMILSVFGNSVKFCFPKVNRPQSDETQMNIISEFA